MIHDSILKESPPNLPNTGDRVTLMRDRLESIKRNYEGMLYFCHRITGYPQDKISMSLLSNFEIARFHRHEAYVRNHCWPVSLYLSRIHQLEEQVLSLGGKLDEVTLHDP